MFKFGTQKIIENYPNKSGKTALLVMETINIFEDELQSMCIHNNITEEQIKAFRYIAVEITPDGFRVPVNFIGKRTEFIICKIVNSINKANGYEQYDVDELMESMYGLAELDEPLITTDPIYLN